MNTVFHIWDSCRHPFLLRASRIFCLHYFTRVLSWRVVNWLKTDQLKTDVWKLCLFLAPVKVSDNHSAWESRFPCRPLGDVSSVRFFPTVSRADSQLMESLGILQLSPLCLRSGPPCLKENHFWLVQVISLEHLCLLWTGKVILLIHLAWSGKHVMVAMRQEDFQKHLLLLPLFQSLWPQPWQGDSWVPPALFIPMISPAFILVCSWLENVKTKKSSSFRIRICCDFPVIFAEVL